MIVQIAKNLLLKAIKKGDDPNLALAAHRTTNRYDMKSPVEVLMGQSLKSRLLTIYNTLYNVTNNPMEKITIREKTSRNST